MLGRARRIVRVAALVLACAGLCGCLGDTPQRARIERVDVLREHGGVVLQIDQSLRFSSTMLRALGQGIPLRLAYAAEGCLGAAPWKRGKVIELRYAPVRRVYELHAEDEIRRFGRRSALLAALDRIRLPVPGLPESCSGRVSVVLDLTSLPTPLRFPAFFSPADWRMVSPEFVWSADAS